MSIVKSSTRKGSVSNRTLVPEKKNEQRMQTILAQDTNYISSLTGTEFQEFVDWLEQSTIPDADKLRAALLERRKLIEERNKLDIELYEVRRRRAAKFGPIGSILFWLTQTPPNGIVSNTKLLFIIIIPFIILFILVYNLNTSWILVKRWDLEDAKTHKGVYM